MGKQWVAAQTKKTLVGERRLRTTIIMNVKNYEFLILNYELKTTKIFSVFRVFSG